MPLAGDHWFSSLLATVRKVLAKDFQDLKEGEVAKISGEGAKGDKQQVRQGSKQGKLFQSFYHTERITVVSSDSLCRAASM